MTILYPRTSLRVVHLNGSRTGVVYIAFSHLGAVYVVDSGGSHLQLVDREAYTPRVSPDGSRIAYSAYKESGWLPWNHVESWEIMTANPDGSDHRKLTENATFDMDPVWSPDGTSIFFRSVSGDYDSTGISVVAANGSDSPVAINEVYTAGDDPIIKAPVLSPDGSRIAFSVGKHDLGSDLYVVEIDGSGLTKLDEETSLPAWSPDSRRIAFAKREVEDGGYVAVRIYTIGIDGTDVRELISFPEGEVVWTDNISWSPDGSEILFGSYIVDTDTYALRTFPASELASLSPVDSRIAVYNQIIGPGGVLYTVARDGSDVRVLVEQDEDGNLVAAKGR